MDQLILFSPGNKQFWGDKLYRLVLRVDNNGETREPSWRSNLNIIESARWSE